MINKPLYNPTAPVETYNDLLERTQEWEFEMAFVKDAGTYAVRKGWGQPWTMRNIAPHFNEGDQINSKQLASINYKLDLILDILKGDD